MKIPRVHIERPSGLFFTSDLHFFHKRIIDYCQRPFMDENEMAEALVANWNSVVPKDGQVFVLGDMFWVRGTVEDCVSLMQRLNGRKWLIAGNHDYLSPEKYREIGFEDAVDFMKINVEGQKLVLFHYPILEWPGFYHGAWHLHGHVHGRGSHFSHRVMDVGVDCNNFFPFSWAQISGRLSGGMELDELEMQERGEEVKHRPYTFGKRE